MKKIIKYALIAIIGLGSLQARGEGKKCNDLILILDPRLKEKVDGEETALAAEFMVALQEKAAPIIITTNIVENFCFWKNEYAEILDEIKKEALTTRNANPRTSTILAKYQNQKPTSKNLIAELPLISLTSLTDNDWHCYAHKQANLILLIPKGRIKYQITECGFNSDNLNGISNVSPQSILQYIQSNRIEKSTNFINALGSMFITTKSPLFNKDKTWNIYLTGHGDPSLKQDGKIAPETSYIAGLAFNDFSQLINFFNKDIQTSFFHYASCFAGGYNQAFVNEVLSQLNVDFITVAEGINESETEAFVPPLILNKNNTAFVFSHMKFTNFFGLLEDFFGNPVAFIATPKDQAGLQKDPIATIVRNLIEVQNEGAMEKNQPFVRIPSVGVFNALTVDKTVKVLTNSIIKAHEFEGKPFNFSDKDIKTLIVYPTYVGVSLNLNEGTSIVSPQPRTIKDMGQTTHIFKNVIFNSIPGNLIYAFTKLNTSYSKITFVIKELQCLNRKTLGFGIADKQVSIQNMIIQITGNLDPEKKAEKPNIDADINIIFAVNDKTYLFSKHIESIAEGGDLVDALDNLKFSPATPEQINNLADKILGTKEALSARSSSQEITSQLIAEQFEKKIEKDFNVQKPGALKKVLLLKQLDSLERTTDPMQLKKENLIIANSKEPMTSFTTMLDRHQDELEKLTKEIATLNLGKQEGDAIQQRIANVQANISAAKTN